MKYLFVVLLCLTASLVGKVRILTFHYNQANFIELQHRCLQKFMLDDYELIVFNDASSVQNEKEIRETCERLGIQCVRFLPEWHESDPLNAQIKSWLHDPTLLDRSFLNIPEEEVARQPSVRHCHVIQYALDHYGYDHDDPVVILDGDAFLIRKMSIKKRLEEVDIFGLTREVKDKRVSYLWVPFVAFHPKKLPDVKDLRFHVAVLYHHMQDTGAESQHYLESHPQVKCLKTPPHGTHALNRRSDKELKLAGYKKNERWLIRHLPRIAPAEFNIENGILHFRAVSFEQPGHKEKARYLMEFMDKILK